MYHILLLSILTITVIVVIITIIIIIYTIINTLVHWWDYHHPIKEVMRGLDDLVK